MSRPCSIGWPGCGCSTGCPFEYLVADAGLLRPETIRFFHLDRNWTDAAVDGALAAGCLRDPGPRRPCRPRTAPSVTKSTTPSAASSVRTPRHWRDRQDHRLPAPLAGSVRLAGPDSRAFRRWRAPTRRCRLCASNGLSPSVLAALFDDQPTPVEIEEPRQGIQFGVTSGANRTWSAPGAQRIDRRPSRPRTWVCRSAGVRPGCCT